MLMVVDCTVADDSDSEEAGEVDLQVPVDDSAASSSLIVLSNGLNVSDNSAEVSYLLAMRQFLSVVF